MRRPITNGQDMHKGVTLTKAARAGPQNQTRRVTTFSMLHAWLTGKLIILKRFMHAMLPRKGTDTETDTPPE